MSVTIRPYRRGGWHVDIRVSLPNGRKLRERRKSPFSSKLATRRWGETREREIFDESLRVEKEPQKEIPTLADFAPRFVEGYARANRQKPSGIAAKETIIEVHLKPFLGKKKLDEISSEDVQRLKSRLGNRAPKTVNNVLSVLSTMLRVAVEWKVIDEMPCSVRQVRVPRSEAEFHDFADYEALVDAARRTGPLSHLAILLGGDAGLRCGEMMALEWTDIDLNNRQLRVQRSEWKGNVTAPKSGRPRFIPMTVALGEALNRYRHLRSRRVLCETNGQSLTQKRVQIEVRNAARLANLANEGVHILRHTFCSHLSMRGAAARAIQELAGHKDLTTTQRYMHLSPAALEASIQLLDGRDSDKNRGNSWQHTGNRKEQKQ